jgi:hypothetical protein
MGRWKFLALLMSILIVGALVLWGTALVARPKALLAFPLGIAALYIILYVEYLQTCPAKVWLRTVIGLCILVTCTVLAYFGVPSGKGPQLVVILTLLLSLYLSFGHLGREELKNRGL